MTIAEFPALLDKARVLADQFALSASHYDETGNFPFVNFDQLHEADLLRLTSTRENGGLGGGLTEAQAIVAEIARGEPSTALVLAMHYSHHNQISRGGKWPRHLVERVSAANLAGPALVNSAQVEPRVGSPSHGTLPETVARRDGDIWRISGHKNYATGIPALKYVSVLAVTDEPQPRLASFLVPTADAKRPLGLQPGLVKHQVIESAVAITSLVLDLGGNPGLKRNHPLERHHRDALCGRAHAPQNNMIRVMVAKAALARRAGVPASTAANAATQPIAQKGPRLSLVNG